MTQTGSPVQTLKAAAVAQPTDTLMGALLILDANTTPSEAERLTYAALADVVEERHHLTDALDAIFTDDFTGTYADALLIALAAVEG